MGTPDKRAKSVAKPSRNGPNGAAEAKPTLTKLQLVKYKLASIFFRKKRESAPAVDAAKASTQPIGSSETTPPLTTDGKKTMKTSSVFSVTDTRWMSGKMSSRNRSSSSKRSRRHCSLRAVTVDDDVVDAVPLLTNSLFALCAALPDKATAPVMSSAQRRLHLQQLSLPMFSSSCTPPCETSASSVSSASLNLILANTDQQRLALLMLVHEACRNGFVTGYYKEYVTAALGATELDAEMLRFHFDLEWQPLLDDVRGFLDRHVPVRSTRAKSQRAAAAAAASASSSSSDLPAAAAVAATAHVDAADAALDSPLQLVLHGILLLELFQRFADAQQFVARGLREIQRGMQMADAVASSPQEAAAAAAATATALGAAASPPDTATGDGQDDGEDDDTDCSLPTSSFMFAASSERFTQRDHPGSPADGGAEPSVPRILQHLPLRLQLDADWKSEIVTERRQRKLRLIASNLAAGWTLLM